MGFIRFSLDHRSRTTALTSESNGESPYERYDRDVYMYLVLLPCTRNVKPWCRKVTAKWVIRPLVLSLFAIVLTCHSILQVVDNVCLHTCTIDMVPRGVWCFV